MTAAAPVIPPTCTGVEDPHDPGEQSTEARVPLPSFPSTFRPQHCTVPSGRRIHAWNPPPATAVGVRAPFAVNCCVWPTPMVGFAGVTVRASAGAPCQPRVSHRAARPVPRSFNLPSPRFMIPAFQTAPWLLGGYLYATRTPRNSGRKPETREAESLTRGWGHS